MSVSPRQESGARRRLADACGVLAILSWGTLGLLGQMASSLPPFFVTATCFGGAVAIGIGLLASRRRGGSARAWPGLPEVAIGGLFMFAYHALYLSAFHHAPAIEVTLLNYLWPAFVILIGNTLFGLGAGWRGVAAAAIGFAGVAVLLGGAPGAEAKTGRWIGLALALAAAAVWGTYCNLRRSGRGDAVAGVTAICAVAALLALLASSVTESLSWPDRRQAIVLALMASGPAGGAFFLWDVAMRHGHAAALAVLAYAAPLISTALLVAVGLAEPSWRIAGATALIAAAGVASLRRDDGS